VKLQNFDNEEDKKAAERKKKGIQKRVKKV
jgi:hypothetical protein